MLIADDINSYMASSSWIRKMFEKGIELKKVFGEDKVYDFSLGNPDFPPPLPVQDAYREMGQDLNRPFALGYMSNAGTPAARQAVADLVSGEQGVPVAASDVIMTCGAGGGLNVILRAILNPDDEVICSAPYFVEYGFYVGNYKGRLVPVPSIEPDFHLDTEGIAKAITAKTRAIIINSPNNPTGQIYSKGELSNLAAVLKKHFAETGKVIYILLDEPYRYLNYTDTDVPSVFDLYDYTIVIGSFSKTLSLAGERIGYIAVNPIMQDKQVLLNAAVMTNRILGFINAPIVGQYLVAKAADAKIDLAVYRARRKLMADILTEAGLKFTLPKGTFYFFVKSPIPDDIAFTDVLLRQNILVVPSTGFGFEGYIRLAFCVPDKVISASAPAFKRAMQDFK